MPTMEGPLRRKTLLKEGRKPAVSADTPWARGSTGLSEGPGSGPGCATEWARSAASAAAHRARIVPPPEALGEGVTCTRCTPGARGEQGWAVILGTRGVGHAAPETGIAARRVSGPVLPPSGSRAKQGTRHRDEGSGGLAGSTTSPQAAHAGPRCHWPTAPTHGGALVPCKGLSVFSTHGTRPAQPR